MPSSVFKGQEALALTLHLLVKVAVHRKRQGLFLKFPLVGRRDLYQKDSFPLVVRLRARSISLYKFRVSQDIDRFNAIYRYIW